MKGIRKTASMFVMIAIIISIFTGIFVNNPFIFYVKSQKDNVPHSWDNGTTLNVSVKGIYSRINWFDFQYNNSGTWESARNTMINVNNSAQYRFVVNISSDEGWDDINYINITAWYDNNSETTSYNQSQGGNKNFFIQYKNLTGTATYNLIWPDDEITLGSMTETVSTDNLNGSVLTECYNISFEIIPGYQLRYAPGDESWDTNLKPLGAFGNWTALNDTRSWNFNITIEDGGEDNNGVQSTIWANDEFGVYPFAEIVSAGWPVIAAPPGSNATADTNITIITRSNGNYSLSVNVTTLTHQYTPTNTLSNETIYLRGADKLTSTNFTGSGPLWLYGSETTYANHEANGTAKTSSDIEYKCNIPLGTIAGLYRAKLYYHLRTEL